MKGYFILVKYLFSNSSSLINYDNFSTKRTHAVLLRVCFLSLVLKTIFMTIKFIVDAEAKLPTGGIVKGRITTTDDVTYFFKNEFTELDFYLYMRRGENGWFQSGGPEIQWPQEMVNELGFQIDKFIIPVLNQTKLK